MSFDAAAPFNKQSADVILRSSDQCHFRVHKLVLSEASPVFETMFHLPQPPYVSSDNTDGLAVVPVTEKSRVLDQLLRICYPVANPSLANAEEIGLVLEAAVKYEMDGAKDYCAKALVHPDMLNIDPFTVYALAYYFKLVVETRMAAKATLAFKRLPARRASVVMENVSATALYALMVYREDCQQTARAFARDVGVAWDSILGDSTPLRPCYTPCRKCEPENDGVETEHYISRWVPFDGQVYRADLQQILLEQPYSSAEVGQRLWERTMLALGSRQIQCRKCLEEIIYSLQAFHKEVMESFEGRISEVKCIAQSKGSHKLTQMIVQGTS